MNPLYNKQILTFYLNPFPKNPNQEIQQQYYKKLFVGCRYTMYIY